MESLVYRSSSFLVSLEDVDLQSIRKINIPNLLLSFNSYTRNS